MKHLKLTFEELQISPAPTAEEVTAAEITLQEVDDSSEEKLAEDSGKLVEYEQAAAVVLQSADNLSTFIDSAERELEAGFVSPQTYQSIVAGANEAIGDVADPINVVSVESCGSYRVSLESFRDSAKQKLEEILEFFKKLMTAIAAKAKDVAASYFDANRRLEAKAILVSKEARKLYTSLGRIRSIPRDDKQQLSFKSGWLSYNQGRMEAHDIIDGLKATSKSVPRVLAEIKLASQEYVKSIEGVIKTLEAEGSSTNAHNVTLTKAVMLGHDHWQSNLISGDVVIEKSVADKYPVFKVIEKSSNTEHDLETPVPEEIMNIADLVRDIANELKASNKINDDIDSIFDHQQKITAGAITAAKEKGTRITDLRHLIDLSRKNFSTDLVRVGVAYRNICNRGLALSIAAIRAY